MPNITLIKNYPNKIKRLNDSPSVWVLGFKCAFRVVINICSWRF